MTTTFSTPGNVNSAGFVFQAINYHHQPAEEAHSFINFKGTGTAVSSYDDHHNLIHNTNNNESQFRFDQNDNIALLQNTNLKGNSSTGSGSSGSGSSSSSNKDGHKPMWDQDNLDQSNYQWNTNSCLVEDDFGSGFETASDFDSIITTTDQNHGDWLYSDHAAVVANSTIQQDSGSPEKAGLKRAKAGESNQALKKQCGNEAKKAKPKSGTSQDPQSIAAKNRRERISERLKILQELVPNGSKVDLVTMLEKAIGYVKFLQLQVKVLATDEFWPVQGGKAPDISQVREAIDAILSSQRDRKSSSK